ncbi:MAG: hypothetical protein GWO20_03320 [Candidatus Korarchaeota archaeon]|nr:hypothetical protein [Candidatus Korarchaeota archaeon]NIU81904.1 hypothetical protein [Candidatus Thorarchaeota archaeon]NIW12362.1 hypothetical protein [Candidatus Thorarchaeota archaeon]NIW51154.1 hypothetical protein [Candidatus Korarchaeota archaeon]
MSGIQAKIVRTVRNSHKVARLLLREKMRKGVEATDLVFVNMEEIAKYHWCPMKALFRSKRMETSHFAAYLQDRLSYAAELGLIDTIPSEKHLLDVGDNISFVDIEQLLEERRTSVSEEKNSPPYLELRSRQGDKAIVLNPQLSQQQKQQYTQEAKASGTPIFNLSVFPPFSREVLVKRLVAEQHPTIRWSFEWKQYVVVGSPDGITNHLTYKFMMASNEFLLQHLKPVILTLADLYGYFFKRNHKKVQVFLTNQETVKTWKEHVNREQVEQTLRKFQRIDEGSPPTSPQKWKCQRCQYRLECTL